MSALLHGCGLLFEKLGDEGWGFFGEFVGAALLDEGDEGGADFGGEEGAFCGPGFAFGFALVDLFDLGHGEFLPCVFDEGIFCAGEVHAGLGFEGGVFEADGCCGGGGDGAEDVWTCLPEEVGEAAAVGMAGGKDALGVHLVVFFEMDHDGVEELEVAISFAACGVLPAGLFALGIGELACGVETLEVDRDGLWHVFVHGEAAACLHGIAAMAMPDEDDRGGRFFGGGGCVHEAGASDAVHGEFEFGNSWGKLDLSEAGGDDGEQGEEEQAAAVHDGMEWNWGLNAMGVPKLQRACELDALR